MPAGKAEIERNKVVVLSAFFISLLTIGLLIYTDYGVHLDEVRNQRFGQRWSQYIIDSLVSLQMSTGLSLSEHDRIHGPVFEVFLFGLQELFNLSDSREIILLRHLCIFLLFYISTFVFYLLCRTGFGSWKIGLLGCALLVLHPRIFSHAFYNTVDIGFLSFYIISTYTLVRFLHDKSFANATLHAATSAILIDIRIAGVILPFCTCLFYALDIFTVKNRKRVLAAIGLYILLLVVFTVLFWPYLWSAPYSNFWHAFTSSSSFGPESSPWHYNFTWIFFTTPAIYSLFFLLGCFSLLNVNGESAATYFSRNKTHLLVIVLFFLPIVLPIVFGTALFDGWRHHYFVYPMFVYVALAGVVYVDTLTSRIPGRTMAKAASFAVSAVLAGSLVSTLTFMFKYHPHEGTYVNTFAKDTTDYWGLSSRRVLEHILNNNSGVVSIYAKHIGPAKFNRKILPLQDRERIIFVKDPEQADYLMTNHRHIEAPPDYEEYYTVKIGAQVLAGAYRRKDNS